MTIGIKYSRSLEKQQQIKEKKMAEAQRMREIEMLRDEDMKERFDNDRVIQFEE